MQMSHGHNATFPFSPSASTVNNPTATTTATSTCMIPPQSNSSSVNNRKCGQGGMDVVVQDELTMVGGTRVSATRSVSKNVESVSSPMRHARVLSATDRCGSGALGGGKKRPREFHTVSQHPYHVQPQQGQQQPQQQQQQQPDGLYYSLNHNQINDTEYTHNDHNGNHCDKDEEGERVEDYPLELEEDVDVEEEDEDEDDEDYDPDDHVVGVCLHCGRGPPVGLVSSSSGMDPRPREGEEVSGVGRRDVGVGCSSNAGDHVASAAVTANANATVIANTPTATGIQVSCDECHSFICSECHWCHEYQANHEIRVCDRCDAFYCKNCDEMDQCEDCGEVVCAGCGALCSCKFCGCGLCEDCATACGR